MSLSESITELRMQLANSKNTALVDLNELEQELLGKHLVIETTGNKVSVNKQIEAVFITVFFELYGLREPDQIKRESYTTIMDIPESEELSSVVLRGVRECRTMLLSQKFGVKIAKEKPESLSPSPFIIGEEAKENLGFKSIASLAASTM